MKVYTITSHVADQVAALEGASIRRRYLLKPLMVALTILTLLAVAYFGAMGQLRAVAVSAGVGGIVLLLLGVIAVAGPDERDIAIKRAGAAGESVLPQLLRPLPDSYTLLNGVPVPGSRADIDHVLVGPPGIWAIEAKNHVGMVQCSGDAWGYARRGPGGTLREGHIGNPSQQAHRAATALSNYLYRRGVTAPVQPAVVFTHPHVELNLEQPTIPVLRAAEVQAWIAEQPARLSPTETTQAVETMRRLRQR